MKTRYAELTYPIGEQALQGKAENSNTCLELIYDQYAPSLFRYALAITNSPDDAEDAVQNVFLNIARDLSRVRKIKNLKAYLYTATRNAAYSILRSKKRDEDHEQGLCTEADRHETSIEESVIRASIIREAFPSLPLEQREVLVLKVFDGMTFREIAETVGVSVNTIIARYRYGIDRMRRALGENCDG